MLKLGISLPGTDLLTEARHVEELGFESAWLSDLQVGDGTPALEAVTALATLAGATEQVKLGFGTLVLPIRQVAWLGAQLLTLQHLSRSRVLLGVGTGGFPQAPFWSAVGASPTGRSRRTDDALQALPALLAGRRVELNATKISLGPPTTMPPVLIGGNSDAAIRRTIRYGDEWFPSLLSPTQLAQGAAELSTQAAAAGRPTPTITIGGHFFVSGPADSFIQNLIELHGMSTEDASAAPMHGRTREEIIATLGAYEEAGAHRAVISVDAENSTAWQRDVEKVAEALR